MPAGDVALVRFSAKFDGEPVMNTFAFVDVSSGTLDFNEMATALTDDLISQFNLLAPESIWTAGLSVQYQLVSLDVIDVVPGTAPMFSRIIGAVGGVADDDAMPPNDALCVTWRSAFKGPSGRGRTYLTGFAEGSGNGGYWELGAQDYAGAIAASMLTRFGEEGSGAFRFVVLHRMSGGTPIFPPEQKPVMAYTVHNEVRSIGRRAVGRRIRRVRSTP